jgi:uracil-DNA glycosylase
MTLFPTGFVADCVKERKPENPSIPTVLTRSPMTPQEAKLVPPGIVVLGGGYAIPVE